MDRGRDPSELWDYGCKSPWGRCAPLVFIPSLVLELALRRQAFVLGKGLVCTQSGLAVDTSDTADTC